MGAYRMPPAPPSDGAAIGLDGNGRHSCLFKVTVEWTMFSASRSIYRTILGKQWCTSYLHRPLVSTVSSTEEKSMNFNPSFDNEPTAYRRLRDIIDVEKDRRMNGPDRFLPISKREDRCDQPIEVCKANSKGRYMAVYRGCTVIKTAEELQIYHQLFWYLRPRTVIELGVGGGGSSLWFADQLKLLDIPGHVYSMDIDLSLLEDNVKNLSPDNVTYIHGDCNAIEKTFTPGMLSELPRPWLLVEDAHANMDGVLSYFHKFLKEGDYLTVEDTNPYAPRDVGYMGTAFDSTPFLGRAKLDMLRRFLLKHEKYYAVDGFLTDLFGYNCTWMWHGFIRRMM